MCGTGSQELSEISFRVAVINEAMDTEPGTFHKIDMHEMYKLGKGT